jgi:heme-degrading monooxygenase HmoA
LAEAFILINTFEVQPVDDDEFVANWEVARGYLQEQPGYIDTALHQAVSPNAEFRFVNIAHWQSPQHFQEAVQSEGFRPPAGKLERFTSHPGLYRVLKT